MKAFDCNENVQAGFSASTGSASARDPFAEDNGYDPNYDPMKDDPDWCEECQGEGRVTTADFESYFGADYKPCPKCGGDPCIGEPATS